MKTGSQRTCPTCGIEFSGAMVFCPVCVLRGAAAEPIESGESSVEEAVRPTPDQLPKRFEHYELVTGENGNPVELGRGAMGVTYKAFDVDLHCPVTLKVIGERYLADESARLRFLQEARTAARLRHSNVASVLHLGKSDGNYFYAMEFVEGETLDHLIRRSGRLDIKLALEIAAQVAAGLAAVHEQNLVHRDIKPTNIMVRLKEEGGVTAKIIDLGLAKTLDESASEARISSLGAFVGTPEFASPEQFSGVGVDIRSDLYSLGITLWVMVTGQAPFRGSTAEVMYQHQQAPLPLEQLKDVVQPAVALLEVLLEKDPRERFQTPAELQEALTRVREAIASGSKLTTDELRSVGELVAVKLSKAKPRKQTVHWLLGSGLCLIVISIAWFFYTRHLVLPNQGATPAAATEKSIAVLPFDNISPNKDDAYFADGVQDEILSNIARISQLKVISRTSVMQYRPNAHRDLRLIAKALGVANILEGTVRRASNRVRITVELIDARNDHAIWSEIYDRDLTDIFTVQSEVAESIARKLTATLSPEERKRIEAKPTDNLKAYDLYLRAKELISRSGVFVAMESDTTLHDASSLLDQAVRLDPEFTLAYCATAQTHGLLYFHYPSSEERAMGGAAIANALRLQPDLPEVRLAYAFYLYFCYDYPDYDRIREQLAIAKPGLTNSAEVFRLEAWMDRRQGKWEKAVQELNEAIARDPGNIPSLYDLSDTMASLRQWSACRQLNDRLNELVPDRLIVKLGKGLISTQERGDDSPLRSAIAALPASMADDPSVLTLRLCIALTDRDWRQLKEIIEKFKGGEDMGQFAYGTRPVPIGCYSILIARLRGESTHANPNFAEARQQLNQKVQKSPENAPLLSQLAVVDAMLENKETAVSEARRAAELLPVSKDAVDGTAILMNSVLVYVWTKEFDRAFETLVPLTKMPAGFCYGQFKLDPYWDPIRKDPRFEKLLAELAPKD